LLPALARLHDRRALPASSVILGAALDPMDDASYRRWAAEALTRHADAQDAASWCDTRVFYQPLPAAKPGTPDDGFASLARRIAELESSRGLPGNRIFYLALPPAAVGPTIEKLAAAGLVTSSGWTRVVLEKPFGFDLESAEALERLVARYLRDDQVYRIDHFLGKETVQNLFAMRFANAVFESMWSRDRVDSIQITAAEELGVEGRAGYYDGVGAVRDMLQNHVLQILALVTMDAPAGMSADSIRYEKAKAIRAIRALRPEDVVLGQYGRGHVGDADVPAYRQEPGIPPDSRTDTFAAARLELDTWRWKGVPIYVRTGKRLARKLTRVSVFFHEPPVDLFSPAGGSPSIPANVLEIGIQPDEGMSLSFQVKVPGDSFELATETLRFGYAQAFGPQLADAYEPLLYDVVQGDQTHFVSSDAVMAGWRLWTPVLRWRLPVHAYPAGSWGPPQADALLARDGRTWRNY
jgi:glucose-6-phosphate 1-dehydrogenase